MVILVHLWLKDDDGADIKGSVDVRDHEESIDILGLVIRWAYQRMIELVNLPECVFTKR